MIVRLMPLRTAAVAGLLSVPLAGCALLAPPNPIEAERVMVNAPSVVAELQAARLPEQLIQFPRRAPVVELSAMQVLEDFVPADYKVFPDPAIDLSKVVRYDSSRSWTDSMARAFADAGIHISVDAAEKSIRLEPEQRKWWSNLWSQF